jgi:hypothetical protein
MDPEVRRVSGLVAASALRGLAYPDHRRRHAAAGRVYFPTANVFVVLEVKGAK